MWWRPRSHKWCHIHTHTRCMLDKQGYMHAHAQALGHPHARSHTHRQICNTYFFSTATIVTRTRLTLTLCVLSPPVCTSFLSLHSYLDWHAVYIPQDLAVSQADSFRLLTAEALVRSQSSPCGICGEQSGFSLSTSALPCHYHSTSAPYSQSIYLAPRQYVCNWQVSKQNTLLSLYMPIPPPPPAKLVYD